MKKIYQREKEYFLLLLAVFLPYLLYGFRYFPVLDDFIQYGCYPKYHDLSYIYLEIGTIKTRPLASILDPLFWGMFWKLPWISLILITVMHYVSGIFFYEVLRKNKETVSLFTLLIYYLLPLGMEGRYWLSASTRIITGLFFVGISLYYLTLYFESGKKKNLVFFSIFHLISCGFYESVSIFVTVFVYLLVLKKKEKKMIIPALVATIHLVLVFVYYKIFSFLGAMESRAALAGTKGIFFKIGDLVKQLFEMAINLYKSTFSGAFAGIKLLLNHSFFGFLILFLILLLSFFISSKLEEKRGKKRYLFFMGVVLFLAPLAPNLLSTKVWITNRSIFSSIFGFALMLEPLFSFLKGKWKKGVFFLLCVIFLTAGVNEYSVYKTVSEKDSRLVSVVAESLSEEAKKGKEPVLVVLSERVMTSQNAFYKDHVKSVFDADWSLCGAVREKTENLKLQFKNPVLEGEKIEEENCQIIYLNVKNEEVKK